MAFSIPSLSTMLDVSAVRVSPTSKVPLIIGAPLSFASRIVPLASATLSSAPEALVKVSVSVLSLSCSESSRSGTEIVLVDSPASKVSVPLVCRVVGPLDRRTAGRGVVHGHRRRRRQVEGHHEVDRRILFGGLGSRPPTAGLPGPCCGSSRSRPAFAPYPSMDCHPESSSTHSPLRQSVVPQSARDELEFLPIVLGRVVDGRDGDRFLRITRVEGNRAARPFVVLALPRMNLDDLPLVVPLVRNFDGDVVHIQPSVIARCRRERQAEVHVSAFLPLGVMHPKSIRVFSVELNLQLGGGGSPRIRRTVGGSVLETVVSDAVVSRPHPSPRHCWRWSSA